MGLAGRRVDAFEGDRRRRQPNGAARRAGLALDWTLTVSTCILVRSGTLSGSGKPGGSPFLTTMRRAFAFGLPLLLLLSLVVTGCDGARPTEPLPSFEALRAAFGGQPDGRGLVRENDAAPYETSATHQTTGEGELAEFRVRLEGEAGPNGRPGTTLTLYRLDGADLQPGLQFESLTVSYGGPGCIGHGNGRLEITSVEGDRIAGVFAADVSTTTLVWCHRRLTGGFTAIPDASGP